MLEEDMYPIVEKYLRAKLIDLEFDHNILSGNASQADLSLPLFGSYIKPDVYGIGESNDGIFRIIMGEGKLTYRGRDLDGVIWQGTSNQRFAHYVYIFFPVAVFGDSKSAIIESIKRECNKLSLGFLLVDLKSETVKEILPADISPYFLDRGSTYDFEVNSLMVRNKIRMSLGASKEVEYVRLPTLRDLSILLSNKEQWKESEIFSAIENTLLPAYQEIEESDKKSSIAKYDWKARNLVLGGDVGKLNEIMRRNLNTLLFFGLISMSDNAIYVKPLCKIFAKLDENNKYSSNTNDKIRDFLTYLLFTTEGINNLAEAVYNILKAQPEVPVWARKEYCPKSRECDRECGFRGKWGTGVEQPFPEELKYNSQEKVHICDIGGESFQFDQLTVASLLHCLDKLLLPEKFKILLSESSLVEQKGRTHTWLRGLS